MDHASMKHSATVKRKRKKVVHSQYLDQPYLFLRELKFYFENEFRDYFTVKFSDADESRVTIHVFGHVDDEDLGAMECLHVSVVKAECDARKTFATCFWVTIHKVTPFSHRTEPLGQIENILGNMKSIMQQLQNSSPGQYILMIDSIDIESNPPVLWNDCNHLEGVNMLLLQTLARGQSHLNELGFYECNFRSIQHEFQKYLKKPFIFLGTIEQNTKYVSCRKRLEIDDDNMMTTIQEVFCGIEKRISCWNDHIDQDSEYEFDDADEFILYCYMIQQQAKKIKSNFPAMFKIMTLDMDRSPEVADDDYRSTTTTARRRRSGTTTTKFSRKRTFLDRESQKHYEPAFPPRPRTTTTEDNKKKLLF